MPNHNKQCTVGQNLQNVTCELFSFFYRKRVISVQLSVVFTNVNVSIGSLAAQLNLRIKMYTVWTEKHYTFFSLFLVICSEFLKN